MKSSIFLFSVILISLGLTSCQPDCDPANNGEVGGEFFSVTYETPAGDNYLENVYRQDKVTVFVDKSGGTDEVPDFELIFPGFKDGTFGPFEFTADWNDPANGRLQVEEILQLPLAYDYYIRKDTFGVDTFRVEFRIGANSCNYFWDYIRYFKNGEELTNNSGSRTVDLNFQE
ncbi:MAG: hypothetical protein MRZ79_14440 [Bacteroidia bacterium]|nr:hypothetical protein [Bacteroidia bacterium]